MDGTMVRTHLADRSTDRQGWPRRRHTLQLPVGRREFRDLSDAATADCLAEAGTPDLTLSGGMTLDRRVDTTADRLLSMTNPWLGSGLELISRHQPLEPLLIIMVDLALAHRHQPDLMLSSKWIDVFTITAVGLLTIKQLWDLRVPL
ncbi:hypothetical protein PTTG_10357 [Puccinia triticina 1-1 BBBD Race 1]|uniref:Uncharacterized protein n=1 Tax=Puccinia triticina (isolate 1-1 / race 1 (BBBD)) TaxID=630390 RepID=A0A180G156_PUCT1|nr:hypothetical protein PTTG_10357 [Puccinia triticina 1-1 BBBD Race 1]WAR58934.1 hypothetical protein PtB15_10B274 [Puccinia triticina]